MRYALIEILVPLLLALLVGYVLSYLIHRWRRRRVSRVQWNALSANLRKAETELETVRYDREKLMDEQKKLTGRVRALTADAESARTGLAAAERSNDQLSGDLDSSRERVTELEASLRVRSSELLAVRRELELSRKRLGTSRQRKEPETVRPEFLAGRPERDEWLTQAKHLVKQLSDRKHRPTRP